MPTVVEKTTIVEVPNDPKPTKTRSIKVKAKPGILSLFCSPGHACDCDEEEHEYEFDEEEELAAAAHKARLIAPSAAVAAKMHSSLRFFLHSIFSFFLFLYRTAPRDAAPFQ